jgi:DNA processing protein
MTAPSRSPDSSIYWLALSLTPQLGPTRVRRLVARFPSLQDIFHASLTELEAAQLPAVSAQSIFNGESLRAAEEEMVRATAAGAAVVSLDDPLYPPLLKQIYDPPAVLYVRGDAAILPEPAIAMVGTRHPTPYGLGMAERLGNDLALRGLVVASGLARGIDAASHRGAVHAKGRSVAVLGTGVDVIYPKENKRLSEEILECGGAIVSEFAIGTFAAPQNFPIRNRIISGLSLGVLVIEAGEYSGTRITARCALEQNRDLFAVPGNVTNKNAWGPNTLIKQGAKLTATWEDVFEELPNDLKLRLQPASESSGAPAASLFQPTEQLSPHERSVIALIKADESTHIDQIVEALAGKLSSSEIFAALFELEMTGRIRQLPGKNYVRSF